MSNKPKDKPRWWHLVINHGPGRQSQYNEWQHLYTADAEEWRDEKHSELQDWDQPAVVKVFETGRPPAEVLEEYSRRALYRFIGQLRELGLMVVLKANLPKDIRKMAADGQELVLVATRGYKWKSEPLAKLIGLTNAVYSVRLKLYVWTL